MRVRLTIMAQEKQ